MNELKLSGARSAKKKLLAGVLAAAFAAPLMIAPVPAFAEGVQAQHQLPSFRQLIKDNASAVVSIRGDRALRPTNNRAPQMPDDMPEPKTKAVDITAILDASQAADVITR